MTARLEPPQLRARGPRHVGLRRGRRVVLVAAPFMLLAAVAAVGVAVARRDAWMQVQAQTRSYYDAGIVDSVEVSLGYWRFPAEIYYNDSSCRTRVQIERAMSSYHSLWRSRSGQLVEISPISWDLMRSRMTVRLLYHYQFVTKKGATLSGISDSRLVWQRRSDGWKLVAATEAVTKER